jgi:hypothetical protein
LLLQTHALLGPVVAGEAIARPTTSKIVHIGWVDNIMALKDSKRAYTPVGGGQA